MSKPKTTKLTYEVAWSSDESDEDYVEALFNSFNKYTRVRNSIITDIRCANAGNCLPRDYLEACIDAMVAKDYNVELVRDWFERMKMVAK